MPHIASGLTENEQLALQREFRRLMKAFPAPLDETDKKNLRQAFEMGLDAHSKQRRKSGEPYFFHPIEVARICVSEIGLGPTAAVCALLHDVVEDTDVTMEDIKREFGDKIGHIVDGLTKLDGLYNVPSEQAENFKKVLSTLVEDVRVVLIKIADRLHNMRTIAPMPKHKQLSIAAETDYIYAPLAHRLGLYNIKSELQDIILRIQEPETYEEIEQKLTEGDQQRKRYIREFIKPLKEKLDELGFEYRIVGRPKSIASIFNKIKKKQVPFEEIYDLFAIRIILNVPQEKEKSACWLVYSILTETHQPIPERLKDWITTPKSNGYESLHTTVIGPKGRFVEIQIRTERMDEIAERGFAAHWKYKNVNTQQYIYENWLDNIRDMLDDSHKDALEFLSDFRTNLYAEELYVYTPKGDLKVMPKGATALDFAFAIHTDVGYHASAIKINNKLVPMGYKLQNGDQVEIITNRNQKPNEEWLRMTVTGKARAKIRNALKDSKKLQSEDGMEKLERKLRGMKVDLEENIDLLARHYGYSSRMDFYYDIAIEHFDLSQLKELEVDGSKIIFPTKQPQRSSVTDTEPFTSPAVGKDMVQPRISIGGEDAEQYKYALATCCNPVIGDDIFAYVTSNAGVKIHRINCPNATHLMASYGYRVQKAEWVTTGNVQSVVNLKITGVDTGPGVIERVTNKISSGLGINIRSLSIEGKEGYFEGKVSLVVSNKNQLNMVIRSLKNLQGISSVYREN
ncbi:MAG: bifunctional (p)ppGpp synthetase/guanosine-3',5'-bis(diphosphate) 3'-pyrophosphohydrolase [Saprospiraceae bacterium]|nr:bifunctional (p)ppGpp synthetase/guanosine-3',5'-bis(diphosphate) 3'-pyrophosphohydrolase [Candidatus Opimibacter iunctus]